ncbi:MAG: molybdate ABC transporter substrate-binding protein [Crocinitomix sp.]|nr:molybdate ABC transporter substrate-binding protein [Crocinitomix sp.]
MRIIIAFLLGFLVSCGASTNNEKTIKIACAANMQLAMDSIAVLFNAEHGIQCEVTTASSGMLTAQIENGAPYDIFVSANMSYPNMIYKNGNGSKPVIYAKGRLLLVVNNQNQYASIDEALADPQIRRIGIANDKTAPYGMAATQYLMETGKMEELKSRLVTGESVGQINQYLITGAVDAAFTSYSFKVKNGNKFNYFEVDPAYFEPIDQAIMILDHGNKHHASESNELLKFFSSLKCKDVLNYFGYLAE